MFKRKIYDKLLEWKNKSNGQTACLVEGARRVGKSTIVEEFAKNNYEEYLIVDIALLYKTNFLNIFKELFKIDIFFRDFFLFFNMSPLKKGSLIIFDEIQFAPIARQAIKYLVKDGRYHYIETGSLVSIKENTEDILIPSEETPIKMYPMDYEEFSWAIGNDYQMECINDIYEKRDVNTCEHIHSKLIKDFRLYLAVGGMPQAVDTYIRTKDFIEVNRIKQTIINLYEEDLNKIDNKFHTKCYLIWKKIPQMLSKHQTRFISSSIDERADSLVFQDSLHKLEESMMVNIVYECTEPKVGFSLTKKNTFFKIYFNDIGLFTSIVYSENNSESDNIYKRLILNTIDTNLGMLFENYVSQSLVTKGNIPYYYSFKEDKNYEIDFITYHNGKIIPFEVKSSRITSLSSITAFKNKYSSSIGEQYIIYTKPLKYGDNMTYLPIYMLFKL